MIVDYHMHLRDSQGDIDFRVDAVERFVERAHECGVDEIGFTEHAYYFRQTRTIWGDPYQTERCVYDLEEYVEAVLEAKRRGLPVKLGLEVDWWPPRNGELAELLAPYAWDFLLGSVHWVDGEAVDSGPGLPSEGHDAYFEAVGDLAESGHVDVLSHLDLVKIFGVHPGGYGRVAERIGRSGCAVEISTAGLRKPVGELYPAPQLLDELRRNGVPITLASDAHDPSLVAQDFDAALALAGSAGYEEVTVFDGRLGRQAPLG